MSESRYKNKTIINNGIEIPPFPEFNNKKGDQQILWSTHINLYSLAQQYYNDSKYGGVIAMYNNIGLESDVKIGQTIYIPSLNKVLNKI